MIVLGIAAGILVLFGVLAAVSGQGTDKPTGTSGPTSVKGTSLLAVPAARALKPIERPGTPPDNIVDALTLPQGSVAGSVKDDNTSATQYDEQMQFSVKASEDTVVNFYKAQLKTDGWSTFSVGPATDLPGGVQVLAQKGGTDGWYWEVGAIVSPTTFARRRAPTRPASPSGCSRSPTTTESRPGPPTGRAGTVPIRPGLAVQAGWPDRTRASAGRSSRSSACRSMTDHTKKSIG